MDTSVITPTPEPSLADLRSMIAAPAAEAKPTPEPAEVSATEIEADPEPADKKQEPKVSDEEALPEGVQKRITKEVERQSGIQRKIDEAVSARKAKESELAALTGKSGSEPAPTTAPVKDSRPTKPQESDSLTWGEYQAKLEKFDSDREAWLMKETRKTVEQEFTQRQEQAASKVRWDAAIKTHGDKFPELMATAQATAPEGLQLAISALDDWSGVAVHLAKNPAQLKELAAKFDANPYAAIATLGRIEASLNPAPKAAAEPLPKPPVVEGGKSSATIGAFDYEAASMSQLRAHVTKLRGR
jgi:hypothetical protein